MASCMNSPVLLAPNPRKPSHCVIAKPKPVFQENRDCASKVVLSSQASILCQREAVFGASSSNASSTFKKPDVEIGFGFIEESVVASQGQKPTITEKVPSPAPIEKCVPHAPTSSKPLSFLQIPSPRPILMFDNRVVSPGISTSPSNHTIALTQLSPYAVSPICRATNPAVPEKNQNITYLHDNDVDFYMVQPHSAILPPTHHEQSDLWEEALTMHNLRRVSIYHRQLYCKFPSTQCNINQDGCSEWDTDSLAQHLDANATGFVSNQAKSYSHPNEGGSVLFQNEKLDFSPGLRLRSISDS